MRLHKEASNLSNPEVFDGFRYSRMNEEHSGRTSHVQMVDTDLNYVVFGHGKHAWYDIPPSSLRIEESLLTHEHW